LEFIRHISKLQAKPQRKPRPNPHEVSKEIVTMQVVTPHNDIQIEFQTIREEEQKIDKMELESWSPQTPPKRGKLKRKGQPPSTEGTEHSPPKRKKLNN